MNKGGYYIKQLRRILALVLALVTIASVASAYATEIQPYASELIGSRSIVLVDNGGGSVAFTARITATSIIEQVGFKSISVQEYDEDTGTWDTVKAVYGKYGYNKGVYAYTVSYSGESGNQYRCKVTYYAKDGDLTDTKYSTSNAMTAK